MIDLLALQPSESERISYSEGFTSAARLFARLADAQRERDTTAQHLLAVLRALTEGDSESLTRATFRAYVHLERELGYDIRPSNTLEAHDNG